MTVDERGAPDGTALSKLLAKVLRHEPGLAGIQLDAQGWVAVDALLAGLTRAAKAPGAAKRLRTLGPLSRELLLEVVATNNKQRFVISDDGKRIRAVQGHSVDVDLQHEVRQPPDVLFHGTARAFWPSIEKEGLRPGSRHAVHLSSDVETARRVGARHGVPLVLSVAAGRMHTEGHRFSRADNGVWLVAAVPSRFLRKAP